MTHLNIAVGIIRDGQQRIFLTQRAAQSHMAGKWEFAGGKFESGETADMALARELNEEVGIDVERASPYEIVEHAFDERRVTLHFYLVEAWRGEPWGREGQPGRWVAQGELDADEFPPANAGIIERLKREATE
ncbi:8-oxo-dGTP diphosphatase MutT [Pantoea sp. 1.19]|uniref:8-oxo-dGTP diphosphatase MutT n=1 Tax=Pantoea sp. 1.19 TaxID=1925589 RepID=UPI0009490071|nr:8-oxo-dGTP diphosphatase MutT [Pantoea sp. 1.19]